jgi:hypothetical protein
VVVVILKWTLTDSYIWDSFLAVYKACQKKNTSFITALCGLSPLVICMGSTYAWLASPYSQALQDHIILFSLAGGIAFGRIAVRYFSFGGLALSLICVFLRPKLFWPM